MIARHHGLRLNLSAVGALARVSRYGTSLYDVARAAGALGLRATPVQIGPDQLGDVSLPAIAHLADDGHFVVVWRAARGRVVVLDPALGVRRLRLDRFAAEWGGVLLLVEAGPSRPLSADLTRPDASTAIGLLRRLSVDGGPLVAALIGSVCLQLLTLLPVFATERVYDGGSTGLASIAGLLGIASVAVFGTGVARYALVARVTLRTERALLEDLYDRVLHGTEALFARFATSDLLARMREVTELRHYVVNNALWIGIELLMLAVSVAALFVVSAPLGLVVVGAVPVYAGATFLASRPVLDHTFAATRAYDRYYNHLKAAFESAVTVRALALVPSFRGWMVERLGATLEHAFRAELLSAVGRSAVRALDVALAGVLLWVGARQHADGAVSLGGLTAGLFLAQRAVVPIGRLAEEWQNLQAVYVSLHRIGALFEAPIESERLPPVAAALPPSRGAVRFDDVWFRYDGDPRDGSRWILSGVDLEVGAGEIVGVVGRSGSGKSTLVHLLLRLADPSRGAVRIDGVDLRTVSPESIRRQIGLVTQSVRVFSASIHDNIACGRPVDGEAVERAARAAGALEFVESLPYGFATRVGEGGLQLSGGQAQRLVIARALVSDPAILVFDEATAAIDPLTEQEIHRHLRELARDRTTFVITHRLHTLRHADRVVVLDGGRIVEHGTPTELLDAGGLFAGLCAATPTWRREEP
ncbi:MAG: peptidase domain-containing ABC transporter [Myxococcota bacterium]